MVFVSLIYHLAMAVADAAAIYILKRSRDAHGWRRACATVFCAAGLLAIVFGPGHFLRLFAYGLFAHLPVVLAASAVMLRRAGRAVSLFSAVAALVLAGVGVDAFWIEPTWLEVSRLELASPKIHRPLRLVVAADLQTDVFGPYERNVLRRAIDLHPDLLLFAGDYVQADGPAQDRLRREIRDFLEEIGVAKVPTFAVRGNVDDEGWHGLFDGLPVTAVESTRSFDLPELRLTCLSLEDSYNSELCLAASDPGRYQVVLGHSPDFALGRIEADLLLAGHTHGGQVRLPGLGSVVWNAQVPRAWASGVTRLASGATLVVSRGIGMERHYTPRLRFYCRPELVVIDLKPAK
jgi:hypothetical protein